MALWLPGPSPGPALGFSFSCGGSQGQIGIGVTYHRLLTTAATRSASPSSTGHALRMLASEGGAFPGSHASHPPRQSDKPGKDLHTLRRGLWSHIGWISVSWASTGRQMEARFAPELVADPVQRVFQSSAPGPQHSLRSGAFRLRGLAARHLGGLPPHRGRPHVTCSSTPPPTPGATDLHPPRAPPTSGGWALAWGEGWHNNHHAFQRSARHGIEWWEFDANWLAIPGLAALGVARHVHLPPQNAERFRIGRPRASHAGRRVRRVEPALSTRATGGEPRGA